VLVGQHGKIQTHKRKFFVKTIKLSGAYPLVIVIVVIGVFCQENTPRKGSKQSSETSFKKDVNPIFAKRCLPCHETENFNPSDLSLDSYDQLIAGGKHGSPVVAGHSRESLLLKKVSEDPPFGKRMPLNTKQQINEGTAKWLTDEEIKTIATWIDQGAKNN
jgi:uncharacterized membrane protein